MCDYELSSCLLLPLTFLLNYRCSIFVSVCSVADTCSWFAHVSSNEFHWFPFSSSWPLNSVAGAEVKVFQSRFHFFHFVWFEHLYTFPSICAVEVINYWRRSTLLVEHALETVHFNPFCYRSIVFEARACTRTIVVVGNLWCKWFKLKFWLLRVKTALLHAECLSLQRESVMLVGCALWG